MDQGHAGRLFIVTKTELLLLIYWFVETNEGQSMADFRRFFTHISLLSWTETHVCMGRVKVGWIGWEDVNLANKLQPF